MLDDQLFAAIATRLEGQLELELDEREDYLTVPRDDGTVDPVWLVLHAHKARGNGFAASLEAVGQLHRLAESVRNSASQMEALWKQIVSSKMTMTSPWAAAPVLRRVERQIGPRQLQFLISCGATQRFLQPLKVFMQSQRIAPNRRMVVGLRIAKTTLSEYGIDDLTEVLPILHDATRAVTLERLDIRDVGLSPPSLHALARLLDRHPVQELRLVNALGRAVLDETVVGVQAILHSVFSPTVTSIHTPIRLSLASISLDGRYFDAVAVEVENGTRRLAALNIANTISTQDPTRRTESWASMARVVLTGHSPNEELCELDLSNNGLTLADIESFDRVHTELVSARLKHIHRALADGVPVSCCIKPISANPPSDWSSIATAADASAEVPITEVDPVQGRLRVRTSPDECVWLYPKSIRSLHCERRECALTVRFNTIQFGAAVGRPSGAIGAWLATVGTDLRRLSLRYASDIHSTLAQLPHLCPRLTHLDIEGCRLYDSEAIWGVLRGCHATLVSINATGEMLGAHGMSELVQLQREVPGLALRHLALKLNHIGLAGLGHVNTLLQESATIEVVELDGGDGNDLGYAEERARVTAQHSGRLINAVPLPLNARVAFLHAVNRVTSNSQTLDEPLLSLIFEFAAQGVVRTIIW